MVKYALVRHPNDKLALGVNQDIESQESITFIHITETEDIDPMRTRRLIYVLMGLMLVTIISAYGT